MDKIIQDNPIILSFCEQPALDLSLSVPFSPEDDFALFLDLCSRIDFYQYIHEPKSNHRCGCSRVRLLMCILYGYTIMDNCSLRKLESLCRYDIRFLWLSDYKEPSSQTFKRVLDSISEEDLHHLVNEITLAITRANDISTDTLYLDGTKLQANAGRYTFVYRKRIEKSIARKNPQITEKLKESEWADPMWIKEHYSSSDLEKMCRELKRKMEEQQIVPVYGRGHRKTSLQRLHDWLYVVYEKYLEYEQQLEIMGENRNSYSKTDTDATFMCLKKDFYLANGITTPSYNIQISVSDGLILDCLVNQDRADAKSWIDMMELHKENFGTYPKIPVADAGYGSLENYRFNQAHGIELTQKYHYYDKKREPSFKKDLYNRYNWPKDANGFYICPQKRVFSEVVYINKEGIPTYQEPEHCEGCPVREECTTAENGRRIRVSEDLDEFQKQVDERFAMEDGWELLKNRKTQVEGAFGILKNNHHLERFKYRGLVKVQKEMYLYMIGFNIRKHCSLQHPEEE